MISVLLILLALSLWLPFFWPRPFYLACVSEFLGKVIIPATITFLLQSVPTPHFVTTIHIRLKFSNIGKTLGLISGLVILLPYFFAPLNKIQPYLETFPFLDKSEIHLFSGIIIIAYIVLLISFIGIIYLTVTVTQNQIDKHKNNQLSKTQ